MLSSASFFFKASFSLRRVWTAVDWSSDSDVTELKLALDDRLEMDWTGAEEVFGPEANGFPGAVDESEMTEMIGWWSSVSLNE